MKFSKVLQSRVFASTFPLIYTQCNFDIIYIVLQIIFFQVSIPNHFSFVLYDFLFFQITVVISFLSNLVITSLSLEHPQFQI